jgi:hypothetical protein
VRTFAFAIKGVFLDVFLDGFLLRLLSIATGFDVGLGVFGLGCGCIYDVFISFVINLFFNPLLLGFLCRSDGGIIIR